MHVSIGASDIPARRHAYESLTGEVPFRGDPHMVFQQVLGEEPRPPRDGMTGFRATWRSSVSRRSIRNRAGDIRLPANSPTTSGAGSAARRFGRGLSVRSSDPGAGAAAGHWSRAWRPRSWLWSRPASSAPFRNGGGPMPRAGEPCSSATERSSSVPLAERNSRQAREAVDTFLTQVSENDVLKAENLEPLRTELLRARDFYERFVEQAPEIGGSQPSWGRPTSDLV